MVGVVGADPAALRRLSLTLADSSDELNRIRRRVEAVPARFQGGGAAGAVTELGRISRWLADGAIDARRRALQLDNAQRRPRERTPWATPVAPWFSTDRCPSVLITARLATPSRRGTPDGQATDHLGVGTTCRAQVEAPAVLATPNGLALVPGSARFNDKGGDERKDDPPAVDGGGAGSNQPPAEVNAGNLKDVNARRVEAHTGLNPEAIKRDYLGQKANISRYNLKRDPASGYLVIVERRSHRVVEITQLRMGAG